MELFAFFQVEATAFENGIFSIFDEGENRYYCRLDIFLLNIMLR